MIFQRQAISCLDRNAPSHPRRPQCTFPALRTALLSFRLSPSSPSEISYRGSVRVLAVLSHTIDLKKPFSLRRMFWLNVAFRVRQCLTNWMNRRVQTSNAYARASLPAMSHAIIPQQCTARPARDGFAMRTLRKKPGIRA